MHACAYIMSMYSAKQVTVGVTMNIDIPKNANWCIARMSMTTIPDLYLNLHVERNGVG